MKLVLLLYELTLQDLKMKATRYIFKLIGTFAVILSLFTPVLIVNYLVNNEDFSGLYRQTIWFNYQ